MSDHLWYRDGLRFTCTQCGRCCGGAPGHVWISEVEIDRLAERMGLDGEAFRRRYTRRVRGRGVSLVEHKNYDCVFFDSARGCTVYEDRPLQCRTWPFWRPNLASEEDWQEASEECPGMDHGHHHDAAQITAVACEDGLPDSEAGA